MYIYGMNILFGVFPVVELLEVLSMKWLKSGLLITLLITQLQIN